MFKLHCEWDIGQDAFIFSSKVSAMDWFNRNVNILNMIDEIDEHEYLDYSAYEDNPSYYHFYSDNGLAGLERLEVI